jgi:arylsulfatase A
MSSVLCIVKVALVVLFPLASGVVGRNDHGINLGKPNIVILFADDLGFGDLGCYGHPTSNTTNLDKMAKEGLRFLDFYVAAAVCSPSRAALLTGRYQTRSGIYPDVLGMASVGGLPLNETTIAEYLKQAGYSTGMIGKWHLGIGENYKFLPGNFGFDNYVGLPGNPGSCPCVTCFYPNVRCDMGCGRGHANSTPGCPVFRNRTIVQQPANMLTLDDMYNEAATDFIKTQAAANKPFFLYYAYHHTHLPQYAGKEFTNTTIRGKFGDALTSLDASVGLILETLKSSGVDSNTLVFFTADNGPQLVSQIQAGNSGPLKCGKGTNYEGGQRVPGIAWWPGKITPGKTRELASSLDLLPTILKLAGVEPKKDVVLDGYDMSSILFQNKASERDTFYYYPVDCTPEDGVFAVRHKQYKAHFYTQGSHCSEPYPDHDCWSATKKAAQNPPLLFDLNKDPSEVYELSPKDPEYNSIMDTMKNLKKTFDSKMEWGESQVSKGSKPNLYPCAVPGCSPFPTCCKTPTHQCPAE